MFRNYRWKWESKLAHDPMKPVPDMGVPGSSAEMTEMIEARKYPRAENQTDDGYVKVRVKMQYLMK